MVLVAPYKNYGKGIQSNSLHFFAFKFCFLIKLAPKIFVSLGANPGSESPKVLKT